MKNFPFHLTRVFISKEKHTKNFASAKICDFLQFFCEFAKKKLQYSKEYKCGITCKKFHKEILIR